MAWDDGISTKIDLVLNTFHTPVDVQDYLDSLLYDGADINRTATEIIEQNRAHCLDGGIFGALALRKFGLQPVLIDLIPAPGTDDDHVLAIFKRHGGWGAIAKSNFVGLRYREPVHRTLRELVMTYFDSYYSVTGQRTLRGYTRPLDLSHFDKLCWWDSHAGLEKVVKRLYRMKNIPILNPEIIPELTRMDKRSYEAGMLGINLDGVYLPFNE